MSIEKTRPQHHTGIKTCLLLGVAAAELNESEASDTQAAGGASVVDSDYQESEEQEIDPADVAAAEAAAEALMAEEAREREAEAERAAKAAAKRAKKKQVGWTCETVYHTADVTCIWSVKKGLGKTRISCECQARLFFWML